MDITLLYNAVKNGDVSRCRELIGAGAPIDGDSISAQTPLQVAVVTDRPDVIRYLISAGASTKPKRPEVGRSLLVMAAQLGHESACRMLLDAGLPVDEPDLDNKTALHLAAFNGHPTIVECLLARGADISKAAVDGKSVLHWSITGRKCPATCQMLVAAGLSPSLSASTGDGRYLTPAQYAIVMDAHEVFRYFVEECGEPVEQRSQDGRTTWQLAQKSPRIQRYLLAIETELAVTGSLRSEMAVERSTARGFAPSPL
jgi:ankyrin repeat protein